jgi:hypothetical protein
MFNDPVYSIFSYSKNEEVQIDLGNIQSKIISTKLLSNHLHYSSCTTLCTNTITNIVPQKNGISKANFHNFPTKKSDFQLNKKEFSALKKVPSNIVKEFFCKISQKYHHVSKKKVIN